MTISGHCLKQSRELGTGDCGRCQSFAIGLRQRFHSLRCGAIVGGARVFSSPACRLALAKRDRISAITTNSGLPEERLTLADAAAIVDSWLEQPNIQLLMPGDEHWILFRR